MILFNILDTYLHTNYGVEALSQLHAELEESLPGYTLLERFVLFLESKSSLKSLVVSDDLKSYAQRLKLNCVDMSFPDSIDALFQTLTPEPMWFVAGSKDNQGLFAVLLSLDPQGRYSIESSNERAEVCLGIEPSRPLTQVESFNLSFTRFSIEQQRLLSLLATQALSSSEIFAASSFALIERGMAWRLRVGGCDNPLFKTGDASQHFFLHPHESAHRQWMLKLNAARLKDPVPLPPSGDYTQFIDWAELWLKDEAKALAQLKDQAPCEFLVQALALHADPKVFAHYADSLVSIQSFLILEPMALMFGQQLRTRLGLFVDELDKFYAFDPAHVRMLCSLLSEDHRQRRMKETQGGTGLALDYWRRSVHF